jgi:TPR repeat protein
MRVSPDTTLPFSAGLIRGLYRGAMGMNCTFKAAAALILAVSFASSVAAGPLEDIDAAFKKGDHETVLRLTRPLAEQGYAPAQGVLGASYAEGKGVPQDYAAAASWLRKAAEQGDAYAQYDLFQPLAR